MSSRFIYNNELPSSPGIFGNSTQPIWLQFVPGVVEFVFTSKQTKGVFNENMVNSIEAKSHYESVSQDNASEIYKPLLRGFVDVPVKGDQVLLMTVGTENYYLGPINTVNSPNFNIDDLYSKREVQSPFDLKYNNVFDFYDETGVSRQFPLKKVERLNKFYSSSGLDAEGEPPIDIPGDMIFEGRFSNSIRVGARSDKPLIIIQNNRDYEKDSETSNEGSLISLLSNGSIRQNFTDDDMIVNDVIENSIFQLSSDIPVNQEPPRTQISNESEEDYNYEYGLNNDQILIRSERITIDSRTDSIFLSSFKHIYLGCKENLNMRISGTTEIDSETIYLGKQVEEPQPAVKGQELRAVLESMLGLIEGLQFICTGAMAPLMLKGAPIVGNPEIQIIKNDLEKILSNKVYLES